MTSTTTANGWGALQKRLDQVGKAISKFRLCDDPDIRDRYQAAKREVARADSYVAALAKDSDKDARALVQKEAKQAQDELAAAQQEYDTHTVTLTFTALERDQVEALLRQHPATEEDEERGTDFHFDTFAPALIAASSLDGMPVEYAATAMKTWSLADSDDLWGAAWSVQRRKRTDLGKD